MKDETWIDKIADKIIDIIDERIKKPGESYSTMAQVIKVDKTKGTAWVAIPGGNPETPAALSIDCKAGDTVQVYVSGHKATLTGNMTAPPTDDTTAIEVKEEVKRVGKTVDFYVTEQGVIKEEAENAQETADNAMTAANGKNKVYIQGTEPTGGTYIENDTWFDTAHDNKIYHYINGAWTPSLLGDDALDTFSANHIVAGSIDASQVTISHLDASNISSGTVAAQYIDAAHLKIGDMINDAGFITDADVPTWYTGTAITGTSTTPTTFSGSGISNATAGDMYLNTSTNNTYQCTLGGAPSVALWKYVDNIGGGDGRGISSITYQSSSGNVDTYKITYTDGTSTTYTVTNGTDVTSQYVTYINSTYGVRVYSASGQPNTYAQVNSNGLTVVKSGSAVASFGTTAVIGYSDGRHVELSNGDLYFYDDTSNLGNIGIVNNSLQFYQNPNCYIQFSDANDTISLISDDIFFSGKLFEIVTAESSTTTVNAGSGGHFYCTGNNTTSPQYRPIAVVGVTSNHTFSGVISHVALTRNGISTVGADVDLINVSNSNQSFKVTAKILCTRIQSTYLV